jgi:CRISPR-associated protein Cas2
MRLLRTAGNAHRTPEKKHPGEGSVRAIFVTRAQWERSFIIHGSPAIEREPEDLPEQIQLW